ncbi:MAG TPA: hypothetical protein VK698_16745 [Kofleriaceae bacterium]|nr:hypothetical protein [Kofleriaceae bacterium]
MESKKDKTDQKPAPGVGEKATQRGALPTEKKQPRRDVVGRDRVDVTSDDSFPASDPPSWTAGHEKPVMPATPRDPAPTPRRKG